MRAASCSPPGRQLPPQDQAAAYTRCPRGPGALLKAPARTAAEANREMAPARRRGT